MIANSLHGLDEQNITDSVDISPTLDKSSILRSLSDIDCSLKEKIDLFSQYIYGQYDQSIVSVKIELSEHWDNLQSIYGQFNKKDRILYVLRSNIRLDIVLDERSYGRVDITYHRNNDIDIDAIRKDIELLAFFLNQQIKQSQLLADTMQLLTEQFYLQFNHDIFARIFGLHTKTEDAVKSLETKSDEKIKKEKIYEFMYECHNEIKEIVSDYDKYYQFSPANTQETDVGRLLNNIIKSVYRCSDYHKPVVNLKRKVKQDIYAELLEYTLYGVFHTVLDLQDEDNITGKIYINLDKQMKNQSQLSILLLGFQDITEKSIDMPHILEKWIDRFRIVCRLNNWTPQIRRKDRQLEIFVQLGT